MQNNVTQYVMYVLFVVGIIVLLLGLVGENYDPMMYVTYAYVGLAVIAGLLGAVMGIINKPQSAKKMIISVVGMVVVLGLAYGLADGSDYENYKEVTESASKLSEMLIYSFYILFLGAVATVIYSWVNKLIR